MILGAVIGLVVLYFAASWTKHRFVDPDRMLVGAHAIDSNEAIVMYRYDRSERVVFRIAKIRTDRDEPLWERDVGLPYTAHVGNGMSVAGDHLVILNDIGNVEDEVTARDLLTGDVAWQRTLSKSEGDASKILGTHRFVLIDGRDRLHILDRATGKTLHERKGHTQNLNFAFTDSWIEIEETMLIEYLEVDSGELRRVEQPRGAQCRIDGRVYGFDDKRGLLSRDLSTGDEVEVLPVGTRIAGNPAEKFLPWSCGWRSAPDGGVRLLLARQDPGFLVAIDFDPDSPLGSGRTAWTHPFAGTIQTGEITYRVRNRLDLVWSGQMPRFAPLEVRLEDASENADEQIVVFDTDSGKLVRQGAPVDRHRFSSFKHGATVFMVLEGRHSDTPGVVLAMDGETGKTRAVIAAGELRTEPQSVAGGAAWTWIYRGFSREGDLAVSVLSPELRVLGTRDASRAPFPNEDVVTALLGPDPTGR